MQPDELLYAKTHEWVHVDASGGGNVATIGISALCGRSPDRPGLHRIARRSGAGEAGESFGEIESVKAVSDLYSPVDGEIVEVNGSLSTHLENLARRSYGRAGSSKIKMADEAESEGLLDYPAYQKQCAEEGH